MQRRPRGLTQRVEEIEQILVAVSRELRAIENIADENDDDELYHAIHQVRLLLDSVNRAR